MNIYNVGVEALVHLFGVDDLVHFLEVGVDLPTLQSTRLHNTPIIIKMKVSYLESKNSKIQKILNRNIQK